MKPLFMILPLLLLSANRNYVYTGPVTEIPEPEAIVTEAPEPEAPPAVTEPEMPPAEAEPETQPVEAAPEPEAEPAAPSSNAFGTSEEDPTLLIVYSGAGGDLAVPEGICCIDEESITDAPEMTSIQLPETLQSIRDENFYNCPMLTEITIPAGVVFIGADSFASLPALKTVAFEGPAPIIHRGCFRDLAPDCVFKVPEDQLEAYKAVLPEGASIESSGASAIQFEIPVSEDDYIFDPDTGTIQEYRGNDYVVKVPESIQGVPVKSLGTYAFSDKERLTKVILPEGLETIGDSCFRYDDYLIWVDCPDSVTGIGTAAFSYAYGGETFDWPAGLVTLGDEAFYCSGLRGTIDLPDTLETIGAECFTNTRADRLVIPEKLVSIGTEAFDSGWLTALTAKGTQSVEIGENAFAGCSIKKIEVPVSAGQDTLDFWKGQFADAEVTATFEPEPEPTPVPTATPTPEPTPEPTEAPEPTATPEPEPTEAPAPEPTEVPEPMDPTPVAGMRYVCDGAKVGTVEVNPADLGGEYSVIFGDDGKADVTIAGVKLPGLAWNVDVDRILIDYFGREPLSLIPDETGYNLYYTDTMIVHLKAE